MKHQTRRAFIKSTTAAAVATLVSPKLLSAMARKKKIGLQLYTIRDVLNQDFVGTIQRISEVGYDVLEAAGYSDGKFYGMEPKEFKTIIEDHGMKVISSHASFNPEKSKKAIKAHAELGVDYIVFPSLPMKTRDTADDYKQAAGIFNRIGEQCNESRIRLGYHNHAYEFELFGDVTGYDILMQNTIPDLVTYQLDLYWATYAGKDPIDLFLNYPGSFESWHVKDMIKDPEPHDTEVGTGIIDFQSIFDARKLAGMKNFFVEMDNCTIDPIESITISYKNISNLDF